jgi:hypothetical protein
VSRAASRVRSPAPFPFARCPAVTAALDAVAEAYHNPAAVWWGAFAPSRSCGRRECGSPFARSASRISRSSPGLIACMARDLGQNRIKHPSPAPPPFSSTAAIPPAVAAVSKLAKRPRSSRHRTCPSQHPSQRARPRARSHAHDGALARRSGFQGGIPSGESHRPRSGTGGDGRHGAALVLRRGVVYQRPSLHHRRGPDRALRSTACPFDCPCGSGLAPGCRRLPAHTA